MNWSAPQTVAGFARGAPNATLLDFAARERARGGRRLLDIGCGAARNAAPLACAGWEVVGTDSSWPMLAAAAARKRDDEGGRVHLVQAAMDALPVADQSADLVIAHGIWNLSSSGAGFRTAVREAARAARPGAGLFLFTFSRHTIPPQASPVSGETFVFTEFAGEPQCFLTATELIDELGAAGFLPDPALLLQELNCPSGLVKASGPVIYEGGFRRAAL